MYLTPVVYPAPKEGFASIIVSYNPAYSINGMYLKSSHRIIYLQFCFIGLGFHFLPYVDYG